MDECNIRKKEKICVSWDKFEIKVKHGQKEWSVEVEATDFLFDLKKKIKDLTDIPTKRQKLRFPDLTKLVERNMVFNDIVKGDTILLEDVFKISVSYKLESPYNVIGSDKVEVNAGDTVQILKAKIYAMIKVNWHNYAREVAEMKLKNKYGETLANDNGTIEENGIKEEGDEIYVNFI
ncbi:hypothetical protein niasHS_018073 [Heterodera schachtii]|uniref:Ubiquitin-like domain-containing protein n=1 Tax=Heterodera schachtii TaxID=97005 RepID=A0ABD2I872_HETSC